MPGRNKETNRIYAARHRARQKEYQAWKKQALARWTEHNTFHVTKQPDGGFRIGLEQTPIEGQRITAEIAELCDMDPDTFIQAMLGEVLADMGGEWKPISKERREIAQLRAENAELMRKAGL